MHGLPRPAIESPDHSEDDRQLSISELQGDPLHYVMAHLDTKSLCSATQVCKSWRAAGSDDNLWHKIASGIWPQSTLRLSPYYQTYQDMCKGNNACSAWPVMDLAVLGKCSTWKYNLPHCFYQCRLFALQYDTKFNIRLTFDARGESDLRPAASSHIALVRDHAEHEYNPEGQMQPDSSELITSWPLRGTSLFVDTLGHFQGVFDICLESSGILWPSVGHSFDTSLVFCYANSVVQGPNEDLEGDYRCVELFKVPAGSLFRDVLVENCTTFQLPQEPEERLQAETRTNSRYLWHSVPSALHQRSEWWGQSVP